MRALDPKMSVELKFLSTASYAAKKNLSDQEIGVLQHRLSVVRKREAQLLGILGDVIEPRSVHDMEAVLNGCGDAVRDLRRIDPTDRERAHSMADDILLRTLRALGAGEVVDAYEELSSTAPWWATS